MFIIVVEDVHQLSRTFNSCYNVDCHNVHQLSRRWLMFNVKLFNVDCHNVHRWLFNVQQHHQLSRRSMFVDVGCSSAFAPLS